MVFALRSPKARVPSLGETNPAAAGAPSTTGGGVGQAGCRSPPGRPAARPGAGLAAAMPAREASRPGLRPEGEGHLPAGQGGGSRALSRPRECGPAARPRRRLTAAARPYPAGRDAPLPPQPRPPRSARPAATTGNPPTPPAEWYGAGKARLAEPCCPKATWPPRLRHTSRLPFAAILSEGGGGPGAGSHLGRGQRAGLTP